MQYNTSNFLGGMLPVMPDASKIPDGCYRIASNIRVRDNVVMPVADPLDISLNLPLGSKQGGEIMGGWAIVFVAGVAYARYVFSNTTIWQALTGYMLSPSAAIIYTEVVPLSFNTFKRNNLGNTEASIPQVANGFYSDQGGGIPCMVAQDGINQPLLIHPDASGLSFTCRRSQNYSEWTPDNPEYVPIGKMMVWDGSRLHIALNGRFKYEKQRLIGKSVNNRPLDFMVVLDSDGNKLVDEAQGDARITSYGVDFDEVTALKVVNNSQPAIVVATAKNLWQAVPDYSQIDQTFGEPIYRPQFISGTGAVGQNAFAETTINIDSGSTAFVSQSGIRAINASSQNRFEGKNYPLSREISTILNGITQLDGAAIQFNDYSYFSLRTKYGNAILVYDSMLSKWVSIDKFSNLTGNIVKFLVARIPGQQKLISISSDRVYLMEEGNTFGPGVYLGDYSAPPNETIRVEQIPTIVRLNFINNSSSGIVSVDVYYDEKLKERLSNSLPSSAIIASLDLPYPSREDNANTIAITISNPVECFRHGYWITWDTNAALSYLAIDSMENKTNTNLEQKIRAFSV